MPLNGDCVGCPQPSSSFVSHQQTELAHHGLKRRHEEEEEEHDSFDDSFEEPAVSIKTVMPPFAGFMTASNKRIEVTEKSILETRHLFHDVQDSAERTEMSCSPIEPARQSVSTVPNFNGFMTAFNKKVEVNANSLKEVRRTLFDTNEEKDTSRAVESNLLAGRTPLTPSMGFMTASNKPISVSKDAMRKARERLGLDEEPCVTTDSKVCKNEDSSDPSRPAIVGFTFTSASGREIPVSDAALKKARHLLSSSDVGGGTSESTAASSTDRVTPPPLLGFTSAAGKAIPVSEEALKKARHLFNSESGDVPGKNTDNAESVTKDLGDRPVPPHMLGFTSAAGKTISVSEEALKKARHLFNSESVDDSGENPTEALAERPVSSPMVGFASASGKIIPVSDAALKKARHLLNSEDDVGDVESTTPITNRPPSSMASSPLTPRFDNKPRGFVSPMMQRIDCLTLNSPAASVPVSSPITPLGRTPTRGRGRFVTPFKRPAFVSPLSEAVRKVDCEPHTGFVCPAKSAIDGSTSDIKPSTNGSFGTAGSTPKSELRGPPVAGSNPSTPMTPHSRQAIQTAHPVPISGLPKQINTVVDIEGVVLTVASCSPRSAAAARFSIEVGDASGSSVSCDVMNSTAIGLSPQKGQVVTLNKVFVKSSLGVVSVLFNEKSSLVLKPAGPETCQLQRLSPSKFKSLSDPFIYSSLFCVGKLDVKKVQKAVVKGSLQKVKLENITYLGCTRCKRKMRNTSDGDVFCEKCKTNDAKNFYVLNAELFDFSGSLPVTIFDAVGAKLLGEDADEAAKMVKYHPDKIRNMLMNLEFSPPMMFRLSLREGKWIVDDFRNISYDTFLPFLKKIVTDKKLL